MPELFEAGQRVLTDISMMLFPNVRIETDEWIRERYSLAHDISLIPRDEELFKAVFDACRQRGENILDPLERGIYAFVRTNAPEPVTQCDSDQRLALAITLSYLVRPNGLSDRFAVRMIGEFGSANCQMYPGARGQTSHTYVTDPNTGFIRPIDVPAMVALQKAFDEYPLNRNSRVGIAFTYFDYLIHQPFIEFRLLFLAIAIEGLVNEGVRPTHYFKNGLISLANIAGSEGVSKKEADALYTMRSRYAHGAEFKDLGDNDKAIYARAECVLRDTIRHAILDADFRNSFETSEGRNTSLGISAPLPKCHAFECPKCLTKHDVLCPE